ncbi:MAG: major capsid protein [Oscillospiraceae bacterium]|nr:major capsid protein [Oscillospiraceae bacterium]
MPIDLYTPRTLRGVIERMPRANTFLRDTFFNDVQTFPTETVEFDIVKGGRELAPFVHPKLDAPVLANEGFQTKEYKAPLVSESTITTAEDLMTREAGEHIYSGRTPASRAVGKIARDLQRMNEAITRREEWMAAQTIFTGKIPVIGPGLNEEIDFNFTQSVTITTAADKWDSGSADILGQLETWCETIQKNGYTNPNVVIMDRTAAHALVTSEQMKGLLDIRNYDLARIAPRQLPNGATWIGSYGKLGLDFYQYNDWYLDNWTDPENPTTKKLVPDGTIAIMSTAARFSRLYGSISYIPYGQQNFITEEADRVASVWVEHNPDRKLLGLQSRPLTVPHEVDSWLVAKVL